MPNKEHIRLRGSARMLAEDEAEIMLYGEICDDFWSAATEHRFADKSAVDFDKELKAIKGASKVTLRINSPGGFCSEAVAMRTMLMNANFPELNIRIEGLCASAATLLACVPGANVSISEGSMFMIHNPFCWASGTADELESTAERLRKEEAGFRAIYAKKCKKDEDEIKAWMDAETWFTAEEALDAGFADEITGKEAPVAACVSPRVMAAMRGMYASIPEAVTEETKVSTVSPTDKSGSTPENTDPEGEESMDISEMTNEQLMSGNRALYDSIMKNGAEAERQRIADIDDLTPAGYEKMAAEAKQSGMSAMDYHKAIVKAQKEKSAQFLSDRASETEGAKDVKGSSSDDTADSAEEALKANAKEIAEYAKSARMMSDGRMY